MKTQKQPVYELTEKVATIRKVMSVLYEGKKPVMRGQRPANVDSFTDDEKKQLKALKNNKNRSEKEESALQALTEKEQKIQEAHRKARKEQTNEVVFDEVELPLLREAFERFDVPKSEEMEGFLGLRTAGNRHIVLSDDPLTIGIALLTHLSGESEHYASENNIRDSVRKFQSLCEERKDAPALGTLERSLAFIALHADHKAKQPVHDLAQFNTPHINWTPSLWYDGIMQEKKLLKHLARADVVEKHLEREKYPALKANENAINKERTNRAAALAVEEKKPKDKQDQEKIARLKEEIETLGIKAKEARTEVSRHEISKTNAKRILAEHGYARAKTINELALPEKQKKELKKYTLLSLEHSLSEQSYNRGFDILADPKLKTSDAIPDITIDGKDLGKDFESYYMVKLQPGDHRGLLLGKLTNCCQSIGDHGTACAGDGMKNPRSGFVAIFKKSKAGVMDPTHDRIIAQSYVWLGKDDATKDHFVFDSYERLGAGDLSQPLPSNKRFL